MTQSWVSRDNCMQKYNKGFTLLEVILVIGVIGILTGIVIFAVSPGQQLEEAQNSQRKSDIRAISDALSQYVIEHEGALPIEIPEEPTEICKVSP